MDERSRAQALVVDDDESVRDALASALEDAGYEALCASGIAAARDVRASVPDLPITDYRSSISGFPPSGSDAAISHYGSTPFCAAAADHAARSARRRSTDSRSWSGRATSVSCSTSSTLDELDLRKNLERLERTLMKKALLKTAGNRAQAARLLGIRRQHLYTRIEARGLDDS